MLRAVAITIGTTVLAAGAAVALSFGHQARSGYEQHAVFRPVGADPGVARRAAAPDPVAARAVPRAASRPVADPAAHRFVPPPAPTAEVGSRALAASMRPVARTSARMGVVGGADLSLGRAPAWDPGAGRVAATPRSDGGIAASAVWSTGVYR
ncbi:hypothetical protein JQC91_17300 [Jannaschia sp. Os4]|uniref:hypothetical protein n=1 Tax=Jannaschia sp. Os4 TaxID=2807617 RepID=UPI00193AC845|nr:hypothetical protein [Jannaschia sp. Os4]MBM2578066.1 hypothetical protein [Jannaschia sp. Os4]